MADRLEEYRRKRDADRTPEPVPPGPAPSGNNDTFVIQQHHARRLHWDLRLERDGVLVSWAVPRGVPREKGRNHLAVHTEDHPLEYATFHGEIPAGEYGGGRMTSHDRGTYETEKWRDDEVIVTLHGTRTDGRYVLFQTGGRDWMIRRLDPTDPSWQPMPRHLRPMQPVSVQPVSVADLPTGDWGYELRWGGARTLAYVSEGRIRLTDGDDRDVTDEYPDLRKLAEDLAPAECVLDGEIVVFAESGRIGPPARRSGRRAARVPVQYLLFDVLWLDGVSTVDLPYRQRREVLDDLALAGPNWQTPPYFPQTAEFALEAARAQGLDGVVGKRLDSPYRPGERSPDWVTVRAEAEPLAAEPAQAEPAQAEPAQAEPAQAEPAQADPAQAEPLAAEHAEVVVVGWRPGGLLLATPDGDGTLRYAGQARTRVPDELLTQLRRAERKTPPVPDVPAAAARDARWVTPRLRGAVSHDGHTADGRLRRPRWLGPL